MTVKELARFAGKEERTVQRWVKKASDKMTSVSDKMSFSTSMYPADYNIDEVEYILQSGSMSKDAVSILMDNARNKQETPTMDYRLIGEMIGQAIKEAVKPLYEQIQANNKPAPEQIEKREITRGDLLKAVNQYCKQYNNNDYRDTWMLIYQELYYNHHKNILVLSKNKGRAKIDIIEDYGLIEPAYNYINRLLQEG